MTKFAEGTLVRRKTGGPFMSVEAIRDDDFVCVTWFDSDDRSQRDTFHQDTLEKWVRAED